MAVALCRGEVEIAPGGGHLAVLVVGLEADAAAGGGGGLAVGVHTAVGGVRGAGIETVDLGNTRQDGAEGAVGGGEDEGADLAGGSGSAAKTGGP